MKPSILIAYICVRGGAKTYDYAARFVGSFIENPPEVDCRVVVCCNGGPVDGETALLFSPLTAAATSCSLYNRPNDGGYDISAYQDVAGKTKSEMMVCFGESVYFHKPGWLVPMVDAWNEFGPGMYGFLSSNLVRPHLNTTAFVCSPEHLRQPPKVRTHQQRYEFEHGKRSLWRRLSEKHIPVALVTWDGIWAPGTWRDGENIMWRGDQSNLLVWCNHVDRWFDADPETRFKWSAGADAQFELAGH